MAGQVRGRRAAAVLSAGALVYSVLLGLAGVTFNATPLLFGAAAAAAGISSGSARLLSIGAALAGWGVSVLLVRSGPLPDDHESGSVPRRSGRGPCGRRDVAHRGGIAATAAAITLVSSGIAFYFEIDNPSVLGSWRLWAVLLLSWSAWEWLHPERGEAGKISPPPGRARAAGRRR
jgi:hypothetical protein